ncbi:MAG: O-antigen ligase family protein, partial [Candidatus Omnitrophota bacterium]|nr:O-antigen ligase family protein [Candidatus Omnitrophota bacterium]
MLNLLLILIFLRPFISSRAFPCLNIGYSAMLLACLAFWIVRRGLPDVKTIRLPLILFALALVISTCRAQDKLNSLGELYNYAGGIILMLACAGLSSRDKEKTLSALAWAGFFIGLLAIIHYQYFFGSHGLLAYLAKEKVPADNYLLDILGRGRAFYPFLNPNILAGYLAMAIPLALAREKKALLMIPMFLALILTQSLGGFLSLFAALAVYFYLRGKPGKKDFLILAALAALLIVFFLLRSLTGKAHTQPAFSSLMRLNYWTGALEIIRSHPLFGVGPGNFNLPQARFAHNSYLQIWAETGILGIASFLWLVILIFKATWKNKALNLALLAAA